MCGSGAGVAPGPVTPADPPSPLPDHCSSAYHRHPTKIHLDTIQTMARNTSKNYKVSHPEKRIKIKYVTPYASRYDFGAWGRG